MFNTTVILNGIKALERKRLTTEPQRQRQNLKTKLNQAYQLLEKGI